MIGARLLLTTRTVSRGGRRDHRRRREFGDRELKEQMQVATEAIRGAVLRLLHEGEVHPEMIVVAVAQVAGEVAATSAIASGRDLEEVLGELFEAVGYAGRRHGETLR